MNLPSRIAAAVAALLLATAAAAQGYPDKPVRLIVPFPPGGSNDVVARVIGAQLSERLGQTILIDNRGGAGGTIGINAAGKSAPDGYTLLLASVGYPLSIALGAMPRESLQWFTPVTSIGTGPSVLVVPISLPVQSLQELIALAKRKPGALNAGSAGSGSFQHLATELFRLRTGIDIVIVQYKGGGPALVDTIAGQVHMNVGSVVQNLPHVRNGKLRVLYEGAPLAFIAEQAGGLASDGTRRILDLQPSHLHQRTPLYLGSAQDVKECETFVQGRNPAITAERRGTNHDTLSASARPAVAPRRQDS